MGYMSAPSAPSPTATAAGQTATNIGTAVANQTLGFVNQNTPYGSLTYEQTGSRQWTDPMSGRTYDLPQYTANQTYTPEGQRILDSTIQSQQNMADLARDQSGRLGGLLSQPMDMQGLPSLRSQVSGGTQQMVGAGPNLQTQFGAAGNIRRTYGDNSSLSRARVEEALMGRMQGGIDRDRKALEQRLADQGIQYGTQAWQAAMGDHGQQVNDARMSAILAGGQEQSRMVGLEADRAAFENSAQAQAYQQNMGRAAFGNQARQQMFGNQMASVGTNNAARAQQFSQNQQQAAFQNQARQQALSERYAQRNQPLNEIAALMSGSQVQNPNFMNISGPQAATTDYAGIVNSGYQNQLAQWQANQGIMGGFMGAGANLLMLSDRRAKEDIKQVGKLDNGQKVYSYRYKGGGPIQLGLMAQNVKKSNPDAVKTLPGGLMAVDYGKATQ